MKESEKKILEEIFGPLNKNEKWECNWKKCAYGMGLVGLGRCIAGGNPLDKNCPNFEDEDEFLQNWEKDRPK